MRGIVWKQLLTMQMRRIESQPADAVPPSLGWPVAGWQALGWQSLGGHSLGGSRWQAMPSRRRRHPLEARARLPCNCPLEKSRWVRWRMTASRTPRRWVMVSTSSFRCTIPIHGPEVHVVAVARPALLLLLQSVPRGRPAGTPWTAAAGRLGLGGDLPGAVDELPSGWSCGETLMARCKGSLQW